ncbi:SBBP repeat-containing protein [Patescibacteria group bacterium]|nr:SBBP repeat-containing protein [Patescibacteria group bacterium]MBU0777256.1 SBBP repeat-containing protein [Patescibacteria group bacterium]MBU0845701.1 SBBP repeat-containing protein [Patescibacteria group bacterium]MBU0923066.1 SBBP repeat-containing protein [Patescibacteria group bacterium]MBU1066619.1 SBBP repeat-containing protein [Patescibacteria group bacterium]
MLKTVSKQIRFVFNFFFLLFVLSLLSPNTIYARDYEWIDQFGNELYYLHDSAGGAVFNDADELYVLSTTYDFLNGNNVRDTFLRKYDQTGSLIWENNSIPGGMGGVALDNESNIYVTTFNLHDGNFVAYLVKLNSSGSELWTKEFGFSSNASIIVHRVAVDNYGNSYVVGVSYGGGFIRKFDPLGNELWTNYHDRSEFRGVTVKDQNLYVSGQANNRSFVGKYDLDGNVQWERENYSVDARDLSIDDFGNIYVVGKSFTGGYIQKYNSEGFELWNREISNPWTTATWSNGVEIGADGVVSVVGGSSSSLTEPYISFGNYRPYVQRYGTGGELLWTYFYTNSDITNGNGRDVAVGSDGRFAVSGQITGTIAGETQDGTDAFVAYYSTNSSPIANAGQDLIIEEGFDLILSGSGSYDQDGFIDIVNYDWDFGDGLTSSGETMSHTFTDNGIYSVTLTVTDAEGKFDSDTVTFTVNNVSPIGTLIISPAAISPGESSTLSFSNQYDPSITDSIAGFTYSYDCTNDGVFESVDSQFATFTCHYPNVGIYTAKGQIKDKDNGYSHYTVAINVRTPSEAIYEIIDLVETFNFEQGIDNGLDGKLDAALSTLDDLNENNDVAAINSLISFINTVENQRDNLITSEQADILITAAQAIIDGLSS